MKPFVKRGKSDAHDARAICEAASRPDMRFIPVKTEEQQAALMQKRGVENLADLVRRLDENDPNIADIPQSALAVMRVLADHLRAVEAHLARIDEQIEAQRRASASAQALGTIRALAP